MGQGLPKRIISRRAWGTAESSCDLSTGSGRHLGRFVSAPVPLPSLSPATVCVIGFASGGDARASHQPTSVRVPAVRLVRGALV